MYIFGIGVGKDDNELHSKTKLAQLKEWAQNEMHTRLNRIFHKVCYGSRDN